MSFEARALERLAQLRATGLLRDQKILRGPQGPRIVLDGQEVLCLCSNNYLGLAGSPLLRRALLDACAEAGVGSGASRLVTGTMHAHVAAESALAEFVAQPDAVLFASGYAANVGALQALLTRADIVFSDRLNHASLIDGARLSRAQVVVYDHCDPDDLRAKLRAHRAAGAAALIVTESLFSMDGDIAPLAALHGLAREFDAGLFVDEAHALGVFGPGGRGLCAERQVRPDVQVGTLGKALGGQGAFVAASAPLCDLVRNRARSYVFSTAPAAPLAALVPVALRAVAADDAGRARLFEHADRLRQGLAALGHRVLGGPGPILPVLMGDPEPTMAFSRALLEQGVFVHGIRPPTVPEGQGRLRLVPMATHEAADIDFALEAFARVTA